ncbi:hypothetical protein Rhe02_00320 [Rhizocola hellebori]|uniref:Secreted protein n=1 Tax=Rhizocola hellebori TaxID=1392758 RepID=A0A8J3Q1E0_9ACTN|nr:hypothetical protein [Rhizocola hellebori]GIH01965.1 hypothetical protein Rhe02_00320 [Rhizocola hellebori]
MPRLRTTARLAAAALMATMAITAAVQAPAIAYDGCWGSGGAHQDYLGNTYGTAWCNAYTGGNVMAGGVSSGYLNAGNSWFVCQEQWVGYENPHVGSARNNYWLYTQADTSTNSKHGWGWFPATKISGGGNYQPIPGLRNCGTIPIFPSPTP